MYFLNIQNFSWVIIKNIGSVLCCIFLFACSATQEVGTQHFSKNSYLHADEHEHATYINEKFYNTYSSKIKTSTIQTSKYSDHQLMISLLNRPITQDQAMMLALKQERMNYTASFSNYGVEIKGNKSDEKVSYRAKSLYSELILQDINAVNISAPQ